MHKIIRLKPNEFQFIYEDEKLTDIPPIKKGDTFEYEGTTYRIEYHAQGFGFEIYSSFLVLAEPVAED